MTNIITRPGTCPEKPGACGAGEATTQMCVKIVNSKKQLHTYLVLYYKHILFVRHCSIR